MFGRRRREAAAAEEAAREEERRVLFAKLAQRPEHICPFLGLEGDRTGYVDGISDEHRCFAFGDPAPLSAEQQTRVCQERGYGNCPRYLRGVLVIPTEELEALRRPRAPIAPPPAEARPERRRRGLLVPLVLAVLLLGGGGTAAYLFMSGALGSGATDSPSPTVTPDASSPPPATESPSAEPSETPSAPAGSPTPEPTPDVGDEFAFYEVAVAPDSYTLYLVGEDGSIDDALTVGFDGFSFARARPVESADGEALWQVEDGDLAGYAYQYPESGDFRVRAVFLSDTGERRSFYLEESELEQVPTETPAPAP